MHVSMVVSVLAEGVSTELVTTTNQQACLSCIETESFLCIHMDTAAHSASRYKHASVCSMEVMGVKLCAEC